MALTCQFINVEEKIKEYRALQKQCSEDLKKVSTDCKNLSIQCKDYVDYASGESDDEDIKNTKFSLENQAKQSNANAISSMTGEIARLQDISRSLKNAMNKEDVLKDGLTQVEKINQKFHNAFINIEEGKVKLTKCEVTF